MSATGFAMTETFVPTQPLAAALRGMTPGGAGKAAPGARHRREFWVASNGAHHGFPVQR